MRQITQLDVEAILNKVSLIGDNGSFLKIQSLVPYQLAFVHKSYVQDQPNGQSNEVLEFLGDAFLGAVVGKYLIDRFDQEQEGFLTKTRTRLVRSNMLYQFARYLGLGEFLLLSPQVEKLTLLGPNKGRNNPRFYEDTFEAFVGAIIQDFGDEAGYKYAKRFIVSIIEHVVDFADILLCNENHKDVLQRYFQSRTLPTDEHKKWPNPVYIDLSSGGSFHSKLFVKGVFLKRDLLATLSKNVQDHCMRYHLEQIRVNEGTVVTEKIKAHVESTDAVLIGMASAAKKIVAEQECSSIALCCLDVDRFF
ncbi:hypothetical protein HDU80_000908 [Chytriomyces hyalinus]|nr:hypothetical protein HDU80_000908 [Chytriomyces hyalinus]